MEHVHGQSAGPEFHSDATIMSKIHAHLAYQFFHFFFHHHGSQTFHTGQSTQHSRHVHGRVPYSCNVQVFQFFLMNGFESKKVKRSRLQYLPFLAPLASTNAAYTFSKVALERMIIIFLISHCIHSWLYLFFGLSNKVKCNWQVWECRQFW